MPRAAQASLPLPPHLARPSAAASWTPQTACPGLRERSPGVPFPPEGQCCSPVTLRLRTPQTALDAACRNSDASGFKTSHFPRDKSTEGSVTVGERRDSGGGGLPAGVRRQTGSPSPDKPPFRLRNRSGPSPAWP